MKSAAIFILNASHKFINIMKQTIVIFFLILSLTFLNCQNEIKTQTNYATDLNECLSKKDIDLINQMVDQFEYLLKQYYKNNAITEAYIKYLEDISHMKVSPDFLLDNKSIELIKSIRKTDTFNKIWIKTSSIKNDSRSEQSVFIDKNKSKSENQFEPYCSNPNGDYINCMIEKIENNNLKEVLSTLKEVPGISPGLLASILIDTLKVKDYNNNLTRIMIVISFYYEFTLNLEGYKSMANTS